MTFKVNHIPLSELLIIKPRNGLYKGKEFQGYGSRWIKMKDIFGKNFILNQKMELIGATDDEISKFGCNKGDLLFGRTSLTLEGIGDCAIVGDVSDTPIFESNLFRLRFDSKKADPYFYYYFFKSKSGKDYIQSIAKQTAATSITASDLVALSVPCPELSSQKSIASVLSSLDDKIDLLHRQNKTLEAMAETLFRQWFVEGVGEDWRDRTLGEFFPVVTGKKDANFSTEDGLYPFFTCSQAAIKAPSYSFDAAAILLSGNGDFNVKRYVGKFEAYQRTYVLIPNDILYFNFLYTLMKYYLSDITGGHQGSVINFITKGMITDFAFRFPESFDVIKDKLAYFDRIYEKVDSNFRQISSLEKLRDNLLPKLMSGEVRVAHA